MDLEELLLAVRNGEPRAWNKLGLALNDELRPYFAKRFDSVVAMDLVQHTIEMIVEKFDEFATEDAAKFRSWVFVFAYFEEQNARRSLHRERERQGALVEFPSGDPSPSSYARNRQEREILRRNLGRLDEPLRRAVEHWLEDGDAESLAEREGIRAGTVRSRGSRGRVQLQELVQAEIKTPST